MVTIIHSMAKYFSISSATSRYQGWYIGFVGNRLPTREPGPVLLPASKGWDWVKKSVNPEATAMEQFYSGGANHGKLWTPVQDGSKADLHVPRLLILPPLFVKLIRDTGRALMPHEVWSLIRAYMETPGLPPECIEACSFVRNWCLVAAQAADADKDSYLAFGLDAVTEQDCDASLATWLETRLDTTLGRQPEQAVPPGPTGFPRTYQHASTVNADVITRAVGQGLALGYQHMLPHRGAPTATTGSGQPGKSGDTAYTADNVCAVMAYSGIEEPVDCQLLWTIFSEKKKNIEACPCYLMKGMMEYAYDGHISIDAEIYLEQETMKAILELRFNPGEGIPYVQSAAKGLSMLCC